MPRSSVRFWILAGLLGTNLIVGVLSLYFLRSVNARYAALFEDGAPAIYTLRTLTREVTGVQRLARRIITPERETAWAELAPKMIEARNRLDIRVQEVGAMQVFKGTSHPGSIAAVSLEYTGYVEQFLELVKDGRLAEATEYNLAVLRPGHDRFQQVLDSSADYIEARGRNLGDRYARDSRFFGGVSLAFASVPIVAVTAGILVMTVLIGLLFLAILNPRADRR